MGCAVPLRVGTPWHVRGPRGESPWEPERRAVDFVAQHNRGYLHPPVDTAAGWTYGVLESDPRAARRVGGGWLLAFPFRCPRDATLARVVFVPDGRGEPRVLYPPVRLPSFAAIPVETAPTRDVRTPPSDARVGVWRPPRVIAGEFVFDGSTLATHFWTRRSWEWAPEDHVFRVPTRWRGNVLEAREPRGTWRAFARAHDDRLVDLHTGEAFARRGAVGWDDASGLSRPRPVHDETIPLNTGPIVVECHGDRCWSNQRSAEPRLCDMRLGRTR